MSNFIPYATADGGPLGPCCPYKIVDDGQPERDITVPLPESGDLIEIHIPSDCPGLSSVSSFTGSNPRNYHCIVKSVADTTFYHEWEVELFICCSFHDSSIRPATVEATPYIESLPEDQKKLLVPLKSALPEESLPATVPLGFGAPLSFRPGFTCDHPSWVIASIVRYTVCAGIPYQPFHPQAGIPLPELARLGTYDRDLRGVTFGQPGLSYHIMGGVYMPVVNCGLLLAPDDGSDVSDDESYYSYGGALMETMHRIAAPYLPQSAKIVEHYDNERREHLHSSIQAWQRGIEAENGED
ncbi:hypothetical protein AZE42_13051 [Rhizopogon vesiculosus]|uniref:Uncharacterized protein n=1 Tax=Rhizopogon vesiculosus TaxID=180088 RepID=A0A1J8RA45_9AGAM|nr:hypothetical protein AZE42_13051 [Rhizopogon vesiculosus]